MLIGLLVAFVCCVIFIWGTSCPIFNSNFSSFLSLSDLIWYASAKTYLQPNAYIFTHIRQLKASSQLQPLLAAPPVEKCNGVISYTYVNTMCKHPSALTFSRGSLLIFKQSEKGYAREYCKTTLRYYECTKVEKWVFS